MTPATHSLMTIGRLFLTFTRSITERSTKISGPTERHNCYEVSQTASENTVRCITPVMSDDTPDQLTSTGDRKFQSRTSGVSVPHVLFSHSLLLPGVTALSNAILSVRTGHLIKRLFSRDHCIKKQRFD